MSEKWKCVNINFPNWITSRNNWVTSCRCVWKPNVSHHELRHEGWNDRRGICHVVVLREKVAPSKIVHAESTLTFFHTLIILSECRSSTFIINKLVSDGVGALWGSFGFMHVWFYDFVLIRRRSTWSLRWEIVMCLTQLQKILHNTQVTFKSSWLAFLNSVLRFRCGAEKIRLVSCPTRSLCEGSTPKLSLWSFSLHADIQCPQPVGVLYRRKVDSVFCAQLVKPHESVQSLGSAGPTLMGPTFWSDPVPSDASPWPGKILEDYRFSLILLQSETTRRKHVWIISLHRVKKGFKCLVSCPLY